MQKANACAHALPVGVKLIVPLPYRQEYRMVSFHFKMFGWNQNKTVHMWKLKKIGPAPLVPENGAHVEAQKNWTRSARTRLARC
jgi:hypothetical protein